MSSIYDVAWRMLYDEEDASWIKDNIKTDRDALNHVVEFEGEHARKYLIENGATASACTRCGIL